MTLASGLNKANALSERIMSITTTTMHGEMFKRFSPVSEV